MDDGGVIMDIDLDADASDSEIKILDPPEVPSKTNEELAELKKVEGNKHFGAQRFIEATRWYSEAISLHQKATYYGNRALCYFKVGSYDLCLSDATTSVTIDPKYLKGYVRQANVHLVRGDTEKARSAIEMAIKQNNGLKSQEMDQELQRITRAEKHMSDVQNNFEKSDYRAVVYYCTQVLEFCPESTPHKILKAEALVYQQKHQEAQEIITDVIRFDKMNVDAFYVRGLVLYYMDSQDKALMHFKEALRLNPEHEKSRKAYSRIKNLMSLKEKGNEAFKKNHLDEAYKIYSDALKMDPLNTLFNAKLHFNRSAVSSKRSPQDLKSALADCNEALKLDPSYQKAVYKRAKLYLDLEMYEDAVRDYENIYRKEKTPAHRKLLDDAKILLKRSQHKDYYKILGISRNATEDEIKKAYKKRALLHHPDRHSNASDAEKKDQEKKFKELGEAYAVLSDSNKKARYDCGQDPLQDSAGHGFSGFDPNDIFASFFAGSSPFGASGAQFTFTGPGGSRRGSSQQSFNGFPF